MQSSGWADPFAGTGYRAIEALGAGGMGVVYLVEHLELGKRFVAKLIHERLAGDAQLVDRVRLEAQSLGRLQHPNIVAVVGFEQTVEGRPFIVMEYLRGATLAQEMASRRLGVAEAVGLTRQLLAALAALHALGLVHRDLKPENLFLDRRAEGAPVLKVLDLGVVRVLPGASPRAPLPLMMKTQAGVVVGTPRYSSPEAALGTELDQRADLYAAGLVLYAMLAGRGPFDHWRGFDELLRAHASEPPPPPSAFAVEPVSPVTPELDQVVLRALDKDPNKRFQSASEFDAALSRVAEMLEQAQVPGWQPTAPFELQRPAGAGSAASGSADVGSAASGPVASGPAAVKPAAAGSAAVGGQSAEAVAVAGSAPSTTLGTIARVAGLLALVLVAALAGIALVRAFRLVQGAG